MKHADASKARSNGVSLFLLLALVTGVQAFATFAVVALPTLAIRAAPTFGLGAQTVGYQISVIYIAAAAVSSMAGIVVRRYGAAATSLAALLFAAAGMLGIASGQVWAAITASLLIGCCYGLTNPAASHLLLRFAPPQHQNLIFALKQTGVPLGAILAASMLPALSERLGWQRACVTGAALIFMLAVPLVLVRAKLDDDRSPSARMSGGPLQGLHVVWHNPVLRSLALMGMTYASFQFCLFTFLITMLVTDFGWSLVAAGGLVSIVQISGAIGRIAWSVLADRIGRGRWILFAIGLLSAAMAFLLAVANQSWSTPMLTIVLVSFGFCLVGWNGLWMAEIARASSRSEVGLATGGVLVFTFIGIVIGPAGFALLYQHLGSYALSYGAFAISPLLGAVALLLGMRARSGPRTP